MKNNHFKFISKVLLVIMIFVSSGVFLIANAAEPSATDNALFNFETDLQGFRASDGNPLIQVALDSTKAYAGKGSMKVTYKASTTEKNADGTDKVTNPQAVTDFTGIPHGKTVTFMVFVPESAKDKIGFIQPMVFDNGWAYNGGFTPAGSIQFGQWNAIKVEFKGGAGDDGHIIFEVGDAKEGGEVWVDSITYDGYGVAATPTVAPTPTPTPIPTPTPTPRPTPLPTLPPMPSYVNMIPGDGSFESYPDGKVTTSSCPVWNFLQNDVATNAAIVSGGANSTTKSFKLETTGWKSAMVEASSSFALKPNTTYNFKAYIKGTLYKVDLTHPGSGSAVTSNVVTYDGGATNLESWTLIEKQFTTGSDTAIDNGKAFRVKFQGSTTAAYIDEMSLTEVSELSLEEWMRMKMNRLNKVFNAEVK